MWSIIKKWLIAGAAAVMALGLLTACMKVTEKKEDTQAAEEETPQPEDAAGGDAQTAKDADAQETESEDGGSVPLGEEMKLDGRIVEIPEDSDDSFIIAKLVKEEADGVSEIGDDPDGTKITVVYSTDTKFVKQTLRDGGVNSEEREGSEDDLKKDLMVKLTGSYYDENTFFVTDVKIVEVI